MEMFGNSEGMEDASQSMIYWFETFAAIINQLKRPEKPKLLSFYNSWKENKIPINKITELLSDLLNGIIKIAINDKSRATENLTLGEFILSHYNKLINQIIILRAKHRPFLAIKINHLEDMGIEVFEIDKKESRRKPTIEMDLEFERRLITGDNIEPMLSMIRPKDFGIFSIMGYIKYWMDILTDFSKFIFIITISFLHRDYLLEELNNFIYDKLNTFLKNINI
ncbi:MAG: hypothetical protein ACTSPY_04520 [Candidatus Helarchaeota archaeon]